MKGIEVSVPNIDELSVEDIINVSVNNGYSVSSAKRFKIISLLYEIWGYELEPDLLLALLDESDRKFIIAPAGGGKTTTVLAGVVVEKIVRNSKLRKGKLRGDNVLCLVYNKHNVKDMLDKHSELVNKLYRSGLQGLNVNDELCVQTMHSFCYMWVREYEAECGIVGHKLMDDVAKTSIMSAALKINLKLRGMDEDTDVSVNNLLGLYNFMRETMLDYEDLEYNDKFIDLGQSFDFIESVFNAYDKQKARRRLYDYTDLFTLFHKLLSTNETAANRIRSNYEYMTADEIQDFTPIMMETLKMLSKDISLTCIGDDDQSIYAFRGADNNNALKFQEIFEDSKVFLLRTNRRCPSNVISLASTIVGLNENRYNKEIRAIKGEGTITYSGYMDRRGELHSIVNSISDMSEEDVKNTCICYRNKSSSLILSNMLLNAHIPFHVLSGIRPFQYELYGNIIQVMNALLNGYSKKSLFNLFKVLPISKKDMADALKYDPIEKVGTDGKDGIELRNIDFGNKINNQKFMGCFKLLCMISENIHKLSMNTYFPRLITMLYEYYWNFMMMQLKLDPEADMEYKLSITKYFDTNLTYPEKFSEYEASKKMCDINQNNRNGLCLSTFHSLKGLEFDNVIIMDLQESIFPNSSLIESKPYDDLTKQGLKECETRLLYVAITRAKKKLRLYYSKSDPSIYIEHLKHMKNTTKISSVVSADGDINMDNALLAELGLDNQSPSNSGDDIISTSLDSLDNVESSNEIKDFDRKETTYRDTIVSRFFK